MVGDEEFLSFSPRETKLNVSRLPDSLIREPSSVMHFHVVSLLSNVQYRLTFHSLSVWTVRSIDSKRRVPSVTRCMECVCLSICLSVLCKSSICRKRVSSPSRDSSRRFCTLCQYIVYICCTQNLKKNVFIPPLTHRWHPVDRDDHILLLREAFSGRQLYATSCLD